ncbi:MAG: rhomboid family intramembrane serine protease [Spirochaetia bacterium]|nr:rhomboid family intramembrane serine protease [Spirochaetia bacterium]
MSYNFIDSTENYKFKHSFFAIEINSKKEEKEFTAYLGAAEIPFETKIINSRIFFIFHELDFLHAREEWEHYLKDKQQKKKTGFEKITKTAYLIYNAVIISLLLSLFHIILQKKGLVSNYLNAGAANNFKIVSGEFLRTASALTLHGDFNHLLSNVIAIMAFAPLLTKETGSGWGWILILFSGIFGNFLNALFHLLFNSQPHLSIGASTSVFGILGILASIRIQSGLKSENKMRDAFLVPLLALLGLFAIMGISGKNTDIFAHVFGMLSGVLLGVFLIKYNIKRNNTLFQSLCWMVFFLIIFLSWVVLL